MTPAEVEDANTYSEERLSKQLLENALLEYGANVDDWSALFDYEKPRIIAIAKRIKHE